MSEGSVPDGFPTPPGAPAGGPRDAPPVDHARLEELLRWVASRPRATLLAQGEFGEKPAWRRPTHHEERWPVALTLAVAIVLQLLVPDRYAIHPQWVVPLIEFAIIVSLWLQDRSRFVNRSMAIRRLAITNLVLIAVNSLISLVLLVHDIAYGHGVHATTLLAAGAEIWLTNTIVFSLIYWEYDRGGSVERADGVAEVPDLLFPQMTDEQLAKNWEPLYVDYLYVSFTNSTAFSPTDTMPLSRWCKALFALQEIMSLVTIGMVAARAVNIFPT